MPVTYDPPKSGDLKWVGKSIRRVEDKKFLMGRGNYVGDYVVAGMAHAALLASPHAHARIRTIDTTRAEALEGVIAVVTGARAAELTDPMPDFGLDPSKHTFRCLAVDKVRYVGEALAAVVAETRAIAEDACALIEVDYEILPAVVDMEQAIESETLVHEAVGSNLVFEGQLKYGEPDEEFAKAAFVVTDRLHWGRCNAQPMETVGAVAQFDPASGMLTIESNSVNLTQFMFLVAGTLKVPSNKLDLRFHPAGGSFGSKFFATKVTVIAGMLARLTGRPVKYLEDRRQNLANSDHHGSDRIYYVSMALDGDGLITAMRYDVIDDYGAYFQFGVGQHGNAMAQVVGPYKMRSFDYKVRAVLTNKCQQGAYRGFGSEVHNWIIERMVDLAAKETGIDAIDIRRRNFIQPDQFPYYIPGGNCYDSGNYEGVLDEALAISKWDDLVAQRDKLRAEGRKVGIGIVTAQERSVYAATEWWFFFDRQGVTSVPESITISIDATGAITATLYSGAFWGNSAETMVAQFIGEEFGVDPHSVNIVYSGTNRALPGSGPGGSRFTVMIAGAIRGASTKIKEKGARVAAHMMEAAPEDVEWTDEAFRVKGSPDHAKTLPEVAAELAMFKHTLPDDISTGLEASEVHDHPFTTNPDVERKDLGVFYPFMGHGCHITMVEVDEDTGKVSFLYYGAVHDCGTLVNPRSLCGHILGGTAQGIGTALHEEFVYDRESGMLQNQNFWDYPIPTAMDVPELTIGHQETPSPFSPYGIKGGGEGGRMMAPAVISAAIDDALYEYGVRVRELPVTPERLLDLIDDAKAGMAS